MPNTEIEAETFLCQGLAKFCAKYPKYGNGSVLLSALAYNSGLGIVKKLHPEKSKRSATAAFSKLTLSAAATKANGTKVSTHVY